MELLKYIMDNPVSIIVIVFVSSLFTMCMTTIVDKFKPISYVSNITYKNGEGGESK